MTITAEDYINRVLDALPRAMPTRTQIAMELRGHIAERLGSGHPVDEVLRQLGDPVRLAESYLSAEPLQAAPFDSRVVAKLIDAAAVGGAMTIVALFLGWLVPLDARVPFTLIVVMIGGSIAFAIYTIAAEYRTGATLGKRMMGLRVVRESGARITLGESVVRQLPMFLQVYLVDAAFALFTERGQRAFELLSKTRTILARGA